jgi:hypothetical protein
LGWKDRRRGRQVEDQAMFGFITRQAASVGAPRRPHVPIDATHDARQGNGGTRHALGRALVTIGQRVAGDTPARS